MKNNILITNIIIRHLSCDSFCKYCYLQERKDTNRKDEYIKPYLYEGKLKDNIEKIMAFSNTYFNSPIIKICGGEIFLMSNLKEFVEVLLQYYPYVLIQTNGKHLDEKNLKWIIDLKRVLVQISLDSHNVEMNSYRFSDEEVMRKVLFAVEALKKNDVYLEITSVLNKLNTRYYDEFVDYLHELPSGNVKNALKVTPIYLIDSTGNFKSTKEDNETIKNLIMEYEKYNSILPPKQYMNLLYSLMQGESLKYKCYNPIVSLNFTDEGKIKACTNILPEDVLNVGDIFLDDHQLIVNKFGRTKFQKMLLETEQRIPLCKNCLNFCSIYNMYLNNSIELEELCDNNYMFGLPEVRSRLEEIKTFIGN